MRNLVKILMLVAMIFVLAACGKENESGSGSSGGSSSDDWYNQDQSGQNYGDYNKLKNYYNSKSLASGVSNNMVVYHLGQAFGGTSLGSSSSSFEFGFCFNFFGELKGDCDQYTGGTNLYSIVEKGEYKVVKSASAGSLNIDVATSVSGNMFQFTNGSFNRNDTLFRDMLNLDNRAVAKVVITEAQVYLTSGKKIAADYVEYFYDDGSQDVDGYVLSSELPIIANPVAVTNNYDLEGILSFAGNNTIKSVTVNIHDLQPYQGVENGQWVEYYKVINRGTRTIQF